jgi:hypothetical protein
MAEPLFRTVDVKDRHGRVTGTKEVALYKGLLAKAHEEGLSFIRTDAIQFATDENARTAISKASITTSKGTFEAIGDASPENVPPHILPHLNRMAETRAKARALRDAVNIGVVSFEELDGTTEAPEISDLGSGALPGNGAAGPPKVTSPPTNAPPARNGGDYQPPMTENQRRYLFRILAGYGIEGDAAHQFLKDKLGVVTLTGVSKLEATKLIDRLLKNLPQEAGRGTDQHQ